MATLCDPLGAARALRGTIQAARKETEDRRRLPNNIIAALLETGLCRLAVPASLGGYEAEPVVALKVYEELAGAEASVAWIRDGSIRSAAQRGRSATASAARSDDP
jgi:alkylation response protein AidB-like acyl-CoA dehydrogenase